MEKIAALINKLQELKDDPAALSELSYYTQLLYAEILHARNTTKKQEIASRANVSVILPGNIPAGGQPVLPNEKPLPVKEKSEELIPVTGNFIPVGEKLEPVAAKPVPVNERPLPVNERPIPSSPKEVPSFTSPVTVPPVTIPGVRSAPAPVPVARRELNETVTAGQPSLNDQLRQSKTELIEKLGEAPVRDLHDAIGINDKFRFIQELFEGDQARYERFITSVNNARNLGEAELWMQREFRERRGRQEDSETMTAFHTLVKKRFSSI